MLKTDFHHSESVSSGRDEDPKFIPIVGQTAKNRRKDGNAEKVRLRM